MIVKLEIKTCKCGDSFGWVLFYSRAGDCFKMMSAHLSRPIISAASAVRAAETATWAG